MQGRPTGWYEVMVSLPDGTKHTALVNSTEIPYRGSPAVLIVMSDITAHKQLEASLRESEEQFRVLTEHSPDTIMLFDRELRHLYVNPAVKYRAWHPCQRSSSARPTSEMGFPGHLVEIWEGRSPERL